MSRWGVGSHVVLEEVEEAPGHSQNWVFVFNVCRLHGGALSPDGVLLRVWEEGDCLSLEKNLGRGVVKGYTLLVM